MSDELEEKRKQKIENFKINYEDNFGMEDVKLKSTAVSEEDNNSIPKDFSNNQTILDEYNNQANDDVSDEQTVRIAGNSEPQQNQQYDDGNVLNSYSKAPVSEDVEVDKRDLRRAKKADQIRRKKKAKKNRTIFRTVWFAMILFASIMLGKYIMVGVNDMLAVGREEEKSVEITIPKDASIDEIADILIDNDVIQNKAFFKFYAFITKSTTGFTQGTFDIYTNKDYQALINYMQSDMNRIDVVTIQFTEGMSIQDYAKLLENNNVCSSEDFLDKCNSEDFDEDYEFLQDITNSSDRYYRLEGYLFPDTYDFYIGEDPDSVVKKFLSNYRRKLYRTKSRVEGFEKKVTIEERAEALGLTIEEVIKIASLIQAEAANSEDMYMVSSVIHNRLNTLDSEGMNEFGEGGLDYLQLDSTVYYPYDSINQIPATSRGTFEGTYDTYTHKGLPDGPICNPGLEAIEAALSPADTDYYYFCHKAATDDSPAESYYAKTSSEHQANLAEAGLLN